MNELNQHLQQLAGILREISSPFSARVTKSAITECASAETTGQERAD